MTTTTPSQPAPFVLLDLRTGDEFSGHSLTELVDQVIPGHGKVPDGPGMLEAQLELRTFELARVASAAQAAVLAEVDVDGLDDDVKTVLFHDRFEDVVDFDHWDGDVPLFLLATGYAPFTDRPRPTGDNVVFLDPYTERTFLDSLKLAGVAELFVHETAQFPDFD